MNEEPEILNTGTLYWFKSQRRGEVPIPLHYLTKEQIDTLVSGLKNSKYELCNPYQYFTTHYMWLDKNKGMYLHVTDIKISADIKRKISSPRSVGKKSEYRITSSDIKRLQNDLQSGKIDHLYVRKFLSSVKWKPWIEKEWKIKRDKIIQDKCLYCGNRENLILQHSVQPRKINAVLYEMVGERFEEVQSFIEKNKNNIQLSFPEDIQKVPVCPKCGSSRIHLRERGENKGTYVCNKTRNYVVCKHKFIDPNYGYDESDIKKSEKKRAAILRDEFCKINGLLRRAVEISLEEIIVYLSLENTKTLCNKCAFKEDKPFEKFY